MSAAVATAPAPATDTGAWSLLTDDALVVHSAPGTRDLVARWLPTSAAPWTERGDAHSRRARIVVSTGTVELAAPDERRTLEFSRFEAWVRADDVLVRSENGSGAVVDATRHEARVHVAPGVFSRRVDDTHYLLTLVSGLLLGRLHRPLAHAAGVVAPDGGGWLLVGDARAGKSTTCVNLARAGWSFLSDDHVVLARGKRAWVEGWPRAVHLDLGWADGRSTGERGSAPAHALAGVTRTRRAPIAGLLFPRVVADEPTSVARVSASTAFTRLLRQSPWLMADVACAVPLAALLADVASLPAYEVRLGHDCYRDARPLLAALADAGAPGIQSSPAAH